MKIATLHLAVIAALMLLAAPGVRASEMDKKTIVTFTAPVEIPGTVLPAGEYVIKRVDPSMPDVVRFMDSDETRVIATVRALPTWRPEPADNVEIAFEERPSNAPQAMKKWFYPGDLTGSEFLYSDSDKVLMASNLTLLEPAKPVSSTSSPSKISSEPTPMASEPTLAQKPVEIAQAQPEPAPAQPSQQYTQPQRTTQPAPATDPNAAPAEELPATASRFPLAASLGMMAIFAGAVLRRLSRKAKVNC